MDGATRSAAASHFRKKRPPGTRLFLPAMLKRVHAWTGFWGALMFVLIGASGFLLNHRTQLKIDTGEPREVMSVVIPVDAGLIRSRKDLGAWAQKQFSTAIEPRAPRAPAGGAGRALGGGVQGEDRSSFMGREVQ